SLSPDQVERIEILRAPTAELGARAIAGTINIVMREGFTQRQERLTTGFGSQRGRVQPGMSWNLSDKLPAGLGGNPGSSYNLNLVAIRLNRLDTTETHTVDPGTAPPTDRQQHDNSSITREFVNLGGRANWRLSGGHTLALQGFAQLAHGESNTASTQTGSPLSWTNAQSDGGNRTSTLRLNPTLTLRLSDASRLELKAGAGRFASSSGSRREVQNGATSLPSFSDNADIVDTSWNLGSKWTHDLGEGQKFVAGAEAEQTQRDETAVSMAGSTVLASASGDTFTASVQRLAAYAQNEWKPAPQWSTYAGLRWEGITSRSEFLNGSARNGSSVWTPLLHGLWKPFEDSRDQVRMSLTRSYRAPTLNNLIPRPSISKSCPLDATTAQDASCPDNIGNPDLKPELATGLELAYEHYIGQNGLFSANLFHRRIRNLMRTLTSTTPIPVSWSPTPRYVSRTENIGNATAQGLELELKAALNELVAGGPAGTQLRLNGSIFRSHVDDIQGPNNRLSEQPRGIVNIGADHRFRPIPYQVGGNLAFTPSYVTQLSNSQTSYAGMKRTLELFAVVPLSTRAQVRVTGSNLFPQRFASGGAYTSTTSITTKDSITPTFTQWQVRLEMRL
ncbi:MAG: TonB-dependent receptor, partial [Burkholderiales bacterium]